MKKYIIVVEDFGMQTEMIAFAKSKKEAEQFARTEYAIDLDCFEDEVDIVSVEEM